MPIQYVEVYHIRVVCQVVTGKWLVCCGIADSDGEIQSAEESGASVVGGGDEEVSFSSSGRHSSMRIFISRSEPEEAP